MLCGLFPTRTACVAGIPTGSSQFFNLTNAAANGYLHGALNSIPAIGALTFTHMHVYPLCALVCCQTA